MPPYETPKLTPPAHLVAAANAALASMAGEFEQMLLQELQRLRAARIAWRRGVGAADLRMAAHDLRGLGGLYGAPMAGRAAASLDRLLGEASPPAALVEAHVDAVLAVVRAGAAAGDDPSARELADALEAAVARVAAGRLPQAA